MVLIWFSEELRVPDSLYGWCLKHSRCPGFLPVCFCEGGGEGGGTDGDVSLSFAHVMTLSVVVRDQPWAGQPSP